MTTPTFFLNTTDVIGVVIMALTNNVTGNLFLTLLMILIFLVALCVAASIPIEWTVIFLLPLILYLFAYNSEFLQIAGFALVYIGVLLAKTWVTNR